MSILDQEPAPLVEDELTVLKERADQMGIKYHTNIGIAGLKEKIAAKSTKAAPAEGEAAQATDEDAVETIAQKRRRIRGEALKLVRVRITCLNPAKKEWEGEIFTVGNSLIGSHTKYVPFNAGDDGYHVTQILLNQLKQRQCQIFYTAKDERGNKVRKGKLIKEFGIEILPQLTPVELKELASRQALSRAVD
jgi:hypothetical protein